MHKSPMDGFSSGINIPIHGPDVKKLCSWSSKLSINCIRLINVKMPTIVAKARGLSPRTGGQAMI